MNQTVCEVSGLQVHYGSRRAVNGVSFSVRIGESLAIVGRNGAGKSSVVQAVLGIGVRSKGIVKLLSESNAPLHFSQIGYCPEDAVPPEFLTVGEYLAFISCVRVSDREARREAVENVTQSFELETRRKINELSKGMLRRVVLAQAFLGRPRILVLDEPLNGLDPLMISSLRNQIISFRSQGGTVLYCSHLLSEAERCCSHALILHNGELLGQDSVASVIDRDGGLEKWFGRLMEPHLRGAEERK